MRALKFTASRIAGTLLVLLVVVFVTYVVFYLVPSDPAQLACGRPCTEQNLALAREFMGLDDPWWRQFLDYLGGIVTGRTFGVGATSIHCGAPCFGYSFQQNTDVVTLIGERLPVTFSLALGAAVLWVVAGVGAGVLAALRRGTAWDRITLAASVAGVSAPVYLVGLLGILVLGFTLDVVPVGGYVPFTDSPVDWAWHLVLPWLVLAFAQAALYLRLTRAQMLETLGEDYIRTARANGLPESSVIGKHALRNVLLPVVTVFGIDLGSLLGGAVITERVFSMPGLGGLLIDAVNQRDLPLLLGCTLFAAFLVVLANALVDLCYGALDPRARLT
ncbi:ABC transporter permease [Saccharothrix coeruleofusca]|uniref:Peptide ABC transporter permease n=1 Tax=Saccharothrix coeruleofusca TaxID=33919 RepID=A0A918AT27_9PSEU|nr:ABC transporter permease [Saccharothrix coeruleofusca]MBP2335556.1 peptide/nickel transport system permease protein [Saccharothrix coeruleofusca]GGP79793.1 peptide ABC transporter permease [Saccharothrix coeruleofusca]